MTDWNLATCLEHVAAWRGDAPALAAGTTRIAWRDFDRRAGNLAAWMTSCGASHQAKVALYTWNHPAYLEGTFAAMKAACVPVNVNYRYREEELRYLLDNADVEFVVVHADFAETLGRVRPDLPKLRGVAVIDAGGAHGLEGAVDYETLAQGDRPPADTARSGDDLLFLYTGGTTGMPKGVMWRQDDLYHRFGGGGLATAPASLEELAAFVGEPANRLRALMGPPLMHGTGWFTAMIALLTGGTVHFLDDTKRFDPADFWGVVTREKPNAVTIVGDSFARPLLAELRANPDRYDLASVRLMTSSGVMWSQETKQGLLEHAPDMVLVDAFGSSEALGLGTSITTAQGVVRTARFQLSDTTRLFDESLRPLAPEPGTRGLVGVGGRQPLGYYKDPEKSARTFVETDDGGRYSIPGDWAVLNDDGATLTLLGRGSVCINTGGEKVFPEEVEEVVKRHDAVRDCVVVGVPDERWGEAITAVVSAGAEVAAEALIAFVKTQLAGYKTPKHVVFVDEVYRSPSGKADFRRTREQALLALGLA